MREFLLVIVYLIGAGVSTGTFVRRFTEWTNADQVTVTCNNTVKIAQYCETGHHSCGNKTIPGVSLEKDGFPTLTITNRFYDSWSCEARGYINDIEKTDNFIVNFLSNQEHTSTPPSPGTTGTSPSPGNNESHSGTIAAGVSVPIIGLVLLLMVILYILYRKVKCFKQAICDIYSNLQRNNSTGQKSTSNEDTEAGEKLQSGSMV